VRDRRAPRGDISLVRFRRASSSSRPRAREERPAIDAAKSARGDGATMRARDATRASDAATALRGALRARAVTAVMTMRFASTRAVDAARRRRAARRSRCAATRGADARTWRRRRRWATDRVSDCLPTRGPPIVGAEKRCKL